MLALKWLFCPLGHAVLNLTQKKVFIRLQHYKHIRTE